VGRYPDKVMLAPYPGMKTRIALTARFCLEAFDDFDEQRILRFIEAHRGIDHHVRSGFSGRFHPSPLTADLPAWQEMECEPDAPALQFPSHATTVRGRRAGAARQGGDVA